MIGLTASFLILAVVVSYILIRPKNPLVKALLIIATVWYAIAVYYAPDAFMGWPRRVNELPDGSLILTYKVVEPSAGESGGMYFWLIEGIKKTPKRLNPAEVFTIIDRKTPRAYQIPYDRELHKKLELAKKKKGKHGLMIWKKGQRVGMAGDGKKQEEEGRFKIINPVDLLPSKDEDN